MNQNSIEKAPQMPADEYYCQVMEYILGQISCYDETYAYPKYHITCDAKIVFRTVAEAEGWISSRVADKEWQPELHHFMMEQRRYGEPYGRGYSRWLYDRNGVRMEYAVPYQEGGHTRFSPRFGRGDIVELVSVSLREQWASLAIVAGAPDYGKYQIIDSVGAMARMVSYLDVMPVRYPVSDALREYLHKCLDTACADEPLARKEYIEQGFALGEFGGLAVCLDVEPATLMPHLHICDRDDRFMVSLRLDRPEYFPHEGRFTDRLQPWQKRALMEYLTRNDCGKPRWWYMLRRFREWYDDHGLNLSPDMPLPDYTLLKD